MGEVEESGIYKGTHTIIYTHNVMYTYNIGSPPHAPIYIAMEI
jgi:hypothetical protein